MFDKAVNKLSMAALGLAFALPTVAGTVTSKGKDLELDTTGGIKIRTTDDEFSFQLGGRMMWDVDYFDGAFNGDNDGDKAVHDSVRRARIEMKGTMYSDWKWKFSYNMTDDSSIDQLAFGYAGMKGHFFQIGQDKEPIGLEELSSSKWITATERSMFWDSTQADGNHFGLLYSGYNGAFTWAAGVFDGGLNNDADDVQSTTARLTYAPMQEAGNVLHFGVAYSDRNPKGSSEESDLINASPGISDQSNGNSDNVFEINIPHSLTVEDETIRAVEFLWIGGPSSVQAEYFQRDLSTDSGPDLETSAYYVTGAYTLTGESRGYKAKSGITDKIKPAGELGAWEVFARYDHIQADCGTAATCAQGESAVGEGDQTAGFNTTLVAGTNPEVNAITVGTNWYVNKAVKFSLNYTMAESDDIVDDASKAAGIDDEGDALTFRAQLVF